MSTADAPPVVLVVDSNPGARDELGRTLRAAGFTVLEAATGAQALEQAAKPLDVVVLNVSLPDAKAADVSRRLKKAAGTVLPVVHVSADAHASLTAVEGLEPGADGYLVVPFDPAEICAAVGALARLRRNEVAQAAQLEASALLHSALDTLTDHVALLADDGAVIAVNNGWAEFALANGYRAGGTGLGVNYIEVCDCATGPGADEARDCASGIREVLSRTRATFSILYPCHSPTVERWYRMSVRAVSGHGPVAAIVTHTERTEEERLLASLERERLRLTTVFDLAPAFLAVVRGDSYIFERVNPAYERLVGARPLIGRTIGDALPEIREQGFIELLDAVRTTGEPFVGHQLEARLERVRGGALETRYINVVYQRVDDPDGEYRIVAHGVDVTEQVVAVNALRSTERKLREQFAKLPVATFLWEARGDDFVLADFNEAARPLIEPNWMDAAGKTATELFPGGWPIRREARQSLRDGAVLRRSVAYESTPGGDARTFDLTIGPQYPDRVLVHAIDTTEQTRLANELRQAQKMEAVGRLAGGVAHDFNNLLTVISAHSSFLLEELPESNELYEDAKAIQQAGDRATALTRQLLAFSRKQILKPAVVDLTRVVQETHKLLSRLVGEDIELALELSPQMGRTLVDVGQVDQVLMNLVINARDAMRSGGRLLISTSNVSVGSGSPDQGVVPAGNYALLTVTDTGQGMDAETQSRIFEPFFTTKEVGKGTGLGLATVYGIVTQSGGRIVVESAPGKGTTFKVYFPVVDDSVAGDASHSSTSTVTGGAETILLVEDDPAVRQIARRVLVGEGYVVLEAPDGAAALALSDSYEGVIDAVISDAVMPGMTGADVLQAIRAQRPGCKAILMSGYTDDDMARRGIRSADVTFVQKPFTPGELARNVRDALDFKGGGA